MVGGTSLVLLASCASTPPARPPIAAPSSRPTSEQPAANPSSPAGPPGSDYPTGYPQLAPAPKARADGSLQSFTRPQYRPLSCQRQHSQFDMDEQQRAAARHLQSLFVDRRRPGRHWEMCTSMLAARPMIRISAFCNGITMQSRQCHSTDSSSTIQCRCCSIQAIRSR